MDGFRMDRTALTSGDMQAILAGLRSLDSISGTNQYRQLMEKISPGSSDLLSGDQYIMIDLASWHKASLSEKIELLHGAIELHRLVSFHYYSPNGESDRIVEPYLLVLQLTNWYVWAWSREKEAPRLFKLERMDALRISESFPPRQMEPPDLLSDRAFPNRYQAVVRINPKYKWRLVEEYGPDCYDLTPEGDCLFSAGFADRDHLLSWILSFEGEAELLEPTELRDELSRIGEKIKQRHQT
jgi:predicted DNA-binding transcriptional regulator YafY